MRMACPHRVSPSGDTSSAVARNASRPDGSVLRFGLRVRGQVWLTRDVATRGVGQADFSRSTSHRRERATLRVPNPDHQKYCSFAMLAHS